MDKQNNRDSRARTSLADAELLKDSEAHYRLLFENSRDGIVMVDNMGRFIDANSTYCTMVGYAIDELRKMEGFYAITPEKWLDWERNEIWYNRLFKTGYSGVYEKEYIRKNGEVFPVELNSFAVFGKDGSPDILFGIARDITERKKVEEALVQSSAELKKRNEELQDALAKIRTLSGMLPICASCKKIRDYKGYWNQIEVYVRDHSEAEFSHGICPDCAKKAYEDLEKLKNKLT